jgi:hypothetical protein
MLPLYWLEATPISIWWSILPPLLYICFFPVRLSMVPQCQCPNSVVATNVWWAAMVETMLGYLVKTFHMAGKLWQPLMHHRLWKANRNPTRTLLLQELLLLYDLHTRPNVSALVTLYPHLCSNNEGVALWLMSWTTHLRWFGLFSLFAGF